MTYIIYNENCLDAMKRLEDNSVDSIVTDPPYGLSFMGKKWDYDVPSTEIWAECLRVLKPGGHLLAFAGTRTQHRMAVRIEDAGFEIRDMIAWVYGSGFPKSLDVSKAIDKAAGRIGHATESIKDALRDAHAKSGMTLAQLNAVCGFEASGYLRASSTWANVLPPSEKWPVLREALSITNEMDALFQEAEREVIGFQQRGKSVNTDFMSGGNNITAPATESAKQWQGWGTALKPALEPITVARKPLIGTVAENVLAHGTGGLNIDGCRVATEDKLSGGHASGGQQMTGGWERPWMKDPDAVAANAERSRQSVSKAEELGRWPANLIHDGSDEVVGLFPKTTSTTRQPTGGKLYAGNSLNHTVTDDTTVRGFNDKGSAARFFYCAKASKRDRDEGLDGFEVKSAHSNLNTKNGTGERLDGNPTAKIANIHPTVKPTDLMRYLCRLVTPPGGVVLDPFTGSGSTGKAAMLEGFSFIGCELSPEYAAIANARIEAAMNQKKDDKPDAQMSLI